MSDQQQPTDIQIPDLNDIPLPDLNEIPIPEPPEEPRGRKKKRKNKRKNHNELLDEEAEKMAKIMGFSRFDTTKGKPVPGNQIGAVHVVKKIRYRQYMNRKGGFNRPLDKVA